MVRRYNNTENFLLEFEQPPTKTPAAPPSAAEVQQDKFIQEQLLRFEGLNYVPKEKGLAELVRAVKRLGGSAFVTEFVDDWLDRSPDWPKPFDVAAFRRRIVSALQDLVPFTPPTDLCPKCNGNGKIIQNKNGDLVVDEKGNFVRCDCRNGQELAEIFFQKPEKNRRKSGSSGLARSGELLTGMLEGRPSGRGKPRGRK
jgi:hypothetical protein